ANRRTEYRAVDHDDAVIARRFIYADNNPLVAFRPLFADLHFTSFMSTVLAQKVQTAYKKFPRKLVQRKCREQLLWIKEEEQGFEDFTEETRFRSADHPRPASSLARVDIGVFPSPTSTKENF